MKNYIPSDFYSANKTTVHATEAACLAAEGSAIGFDASQINLSESKIESGAVVADAAKADAKVKDAQVETAYNLMVSEIYDRMETDFGTRNDVSASAFAATYEAMKKRPANYVDTDLGLADEAAVIAYADSKLVIADAYGVYRLKRIAQYQAEKAAILGA